MVGGRGTSDIRATIGIISGITARLRTALQDSITFPVAVSSMDTSIAQHSSTHVLREVRPPQHEVGGHNWEAVLHARLFFCSTIRKDTDACIVKTRNRGVLLQEISGIYLFIIVIITTVIICGHTTQRESFLKPLSSAWKRQKTKEGLIVRKAFA